MTLKRTLQIAAFAGLTGLTACSSRPPTYPYPYPGEDYPRNGSPEYRRVGDVRFLQHMDSDKVGRTILYQDIPKIDTHEELAIARGAEIAGPVLRDHGVNKINGKYLIEWRINDECRFVYD